jgi:hypothetical protein
MGPEAGPWVVLGLGLLGFLAAVWVFDRVFPVLAARHRAAVEENEDEDPDRAKARRRAASGAAFALQQAFDPGVEHVLRAERDARAEEADPAGGDDNDPPTADSFRAELLASLARAPIDPEEVRRVLTAARREGLDWRSLYDEAARASIAERPYLAPTIPPAPRVAPRG